MFYDIVGFIIGTIVDVLKFLLPYFIYFITVVSGVVLYCSCCYSDSFFTGLHTFFGYVFIGIVCFWLIVGFFYWLYEEVVNLLNRK